ncbi:MAG: hypothetical protein V1708_00750 [Candidatus Micrarchaeota archaeon]
MDKSEARQVIRRAEILSARGLRTEIPLFAVRLDEIPVDAGGENHELISIAKAKERGVLSNKGEPVVLARGLGVPYRTNHLRLLKRGRSARLRLLGETFSFLNAERRWQAKNGQEHAAAEFSLQRPHDYLAWFAKTLGKNLALLHSLGYIHSNLDPLVENKPPSNVCLDCRIIDLDTLKRVNPDRLRRTQKEADGIDWEVMTAGVSAGKLANDVVSLLKLERTGHPKQFRGWGNYYSEMLKESYRAAQLQIEQQIAIQNQ